MEISIYTFLLSSTWKNSKIVYDFVFFLWIFRLGTYTSNVIGLLAVIVRIATDS